MTTRNTICTLATIGQGLCLIAIAAAALTALFQPLIG